MGCGELACEQIARCVEGREQEPVESLEVAVDVFLDRRLLDAVDGGGMAFSHDARAVQAVMALDFHVAIVDRVREVRRRALRHSAADLAVVDDDDGATLTRERVRGRQTADAGPDDANVGSAVAVESRARDGRCVHPGSTRRRAGVHAVSSRFGDASSLPLHVSCLGRA
jgi:hypothetical protein